MVPAARVLVAEDDPIQLRTVADALTQLGLEVVQASNGAELIERLADEGPFALVITDIRMPWMDGLKAMHATRAAGLGTAIIVMTALRDARVDAMVHALGENAMLLRKPFSLADLESAVQTLLAQRPSAPGRAA